MTKVYSYKTNNWSIFYTRSVESTMDEIKKHQYSGEKNKLFMSYMQTKGRGRKKNKWISDLGNIFFSANLNSFNKSKIFLFNYITGIVIYDVIKSFLNSPRKLILKWPNDILINNKKVAGILIESVSKGSKVCDICIGVGINVKKSPFNLSYETTSLKDEGIRKISRIDFINRVTKLFNKWEKILQEKKTSYILKSWMQRSWAMNTEIAFKDNSKFVKGLYQGINEDGSIRVCINNKNISYFTLEVI